MEEAQKIFVDSLSRIQTIRQAEAAAVQYWGKDIPITVLLAELGRAIMKNFDEFSREDRIYIFDVIERGMNSSDNTLNTAVATGLLEAISGQISKDPNLQKKVDAQLGEASKKYLIDWSDWHNSGA